MIDGGAFNANIRPMITAQAPGTPGHTIETTCCGNRRRSAVPLNRSHPSPPIREFHMPQSSVAQ